MTIIAIAAIVFGITSVIQGFMLVQNTLSIKHHTRAINEHTKTLQIQSERLTDQHQQLRYLEKSTIKRRIDERREVVPCTCIPGDDPNQLVHDEQCPMHGM